jgi:hypothetical protein
MDDARPALLDALTLARDIVASCVIAAWFAAVVWLLPLAGVPILGLITGPIGLALLGGGWLPALLGDLRQPLGRAAAGAVLLAAGGMLTSSITLWMTTAAHQAALAHGRGSIGWDGVALALLPLAAALALPYALLVAGLVAARGLRIGGALAAGAVLASVAPVTANTLFLYAWLGLPLSA